MHKSLFLTSVLVGVKTNGISESNELLTKKNHRICLKYGGFYGCGGRTRTYDRGCEVKPRFLICMIVLCSRKEDVVQINFHLADEAIVDLDYLQRASVFVNTPLVDKDLLNQAVQEPCIQFPDV